MKKRFDTKKFSILAILLALVVLLQLFLGQIRIGQTGFSVVLIPIVLGSILLGPSAGCFLGFVFGFITLMAGIMGTDALTTLYFQSNPIGTVLICLGKGCAAGAVPGLLYKLLKDKNEFLSVVLASLSAPVLNTGLFILGSLIFMFPVIRENYNPDVLYFLVILCAGVNFLVELAVNTVLIPVIWRVIKTFGKEK